MAGSELLTEEMSVLLKIGALISEQQATTQNLNN